MNSRIFPGIIVSISISYIRFLMFHILYGNKAFMCSGYSVAISQNLHSALLTISILLGWALCLHGMWESPYEYTGNSMNLYTSKILVKHCRLSFRVALSQQQILSEQNQALAVMYMKWDGSNKLLLIDLYEIKNGPSKCISEDFMVSSISR